MAKLCVINFRFAVICLFLLPGYLWSSPSEPFVRDAQGLVTRAATDKSFFLSLFGSDLTELSCSGQVVPSNSVGINVHSQLARKLKQVTDLGQELLLGKLEYGFAHKHNLSSQRLESQLDRHMAELGLPRFKNSRDFSAGERLLWNTYLDGRRPMPREWLINAVEAFLLLFDNPPSVKYVDDLSAHRAQYAYQFLPFKIVAQLLPDLTDAEAKILFKREITAQQVLEFASTRIEINR